jgi:hypothetical protein
MANALALSEN